MPKYTIHYYFDGRGEVVVEAKSKKEARDIFYNGEFENEHEWGEEYNIQEIQTN